MGTVLVADSSPEFCALAVEMLSAEHWVSCCHTVEDMLLRVRQMRPQVLILDLHLPRMDAAKVLRDLRQGEDYPVVLATTAYFNDYLGSKLGGLMDYVMFKPMDMTALKLNLADLLGRRYPQTLPKPTSELERILLELGIPVTREGLDYIVAAVELLQSDARQAVTKELYPALAQRFHTSAGAAEKAIRDAIRIAWENRDEAVWRRYFAPNPWPIVPRPSNREFLLRITWLTSREAQRLA